MKPTFGNVFAYWAFTWDDVKHSLPKGTGLCLNLGCGNGRCRKYVETAGWKWVGLYVDIARRGAAVAGNALHLPLADESFDLVLLWQVIEHIPHPWEVLDEVHRVLKPREQVFGSVSCMEPFHDNCSYFGFTHKGIEQVLTDCGFTNVSVRPGLNAFALITRSWFKHLLGGKRAERIAFTLVRASFLPLLWIYLSLRMAWNLLRRGELGVDYKQTVRWLAKDAPLEFAGHLLFKGHKPG